jgi:hypothetical protein
MSLGILMGITHDFSLTPVHAHLNLLGWVTMALYGLYYRDRSQAAGRLQWTQVAAAACGIPLMTGGLALMLTQAVPALVGAAEPAVIVGSLLTTTAMALFLTVVLGDALTAAKRRRMLVLDGDFDPRSS